MNCGENYFSFYFVQNAESVKGEEIGKGVAKGKQIVKSVPKK
jgi:hypothetical protein